MKQIVALPFAAITLFAASCTPNQGGPPVAAVSSKPAADIAANTAPYPDASTVAPAVRSIWQIHTIDGLAAIGGNEAIISFREEGTFASAGCNGVGSEAALSGTQLPSGSGISTQMYCAPAELMAQERAIAQLFQAGGRIEPLVNGQFALTGGGHRLVIAAPAISDRAWIVREVNGQLIKGEAEAAIRFDGTGFTGSVGCNRLSGEALIAGNRVVVQQLASTRMACPGPVGEREMAFSRMLRSGATISFAEHGRLWLWLEGDGQRFGFASARDSSSQ